MNNKVLKVASITLRQVRCYKSTHVKVRFAPSPTGQLHLGSLRTALYNYLFARGSNGSFIVRIEDTDQSRVIPGAIDKIHNDLLWVGIIPDEDPIRGGPNGPYVQSKRLELYRDHVQQLVDSDAAYYCFCTEERLNLIRKEALRCGQIPKYDNKCRHLSPAVVKEKLQKKQPYCIRFKLRGLSEPFDDMVYGTVLHDVSASEADPIILKSDGYPTYHLANVVDDHLMEISHVLRGVEWQISTSKHLLLYEAFGWKPPIFGHLPLLLSSDGTKLSKRKNDVFVDSYRKQGIFPIALLNYIIIAGGGFHNETNDRYIESYEKLIKQFDISKIKSSSGKLQPERLLDFNRLEITKLIESKENKTFLVERIQKLVTEAVLERNVQADTVLDEKHVLSILNWAKNRVNTLQDLVRPDLLFLWTVPSYKEKNLNAELSDTLTELSGNLAEQPTKNFNAEWLNEFLKQFAKTNDVSYVNVMKTLRMMLCGLQVGPPVAQVIEILGKDVAIQRINNYLERKTA